ncbi:MAG: TonB-dependent siderophore receptor [Pseudomonadota bacterium]
MNRLFALSACALAASAFVSQAVAQEAGLETIVVTAKRSARVSSGATGLPLDVKETPQSISILDAQTISDFGATGSNEALRLGTGLNVEQYETNRAVFNSRGFEVQSTQIDGLGVINSWGTVVGQQDTYLFDRIELIRGANGLLTGVGNASGTINYVRKRPLNRDGGEVLLSAGSYNAKRAALDYNKVLAQDGSWAGRIVAVVEDKDSYIRDLNDKRGTLYAVVDGQIGRDGMLTLGYTHQDMKQDSPMWGSLTLNYQDGTMADFPRSSSTSADWTYWDTKTDTAFVEYRHSISADWEVKATYSHTRSDEKTKLLYAYYLTTPAYLNPDNTGALGWAYRSATVTENDLIDVNTSGRFTAFGRRHEALAGLSYSSQKTETDTWSPVAGNFLPLPAFPYDGSAYAEPTWGERAPSSDGKQRLTRLYAATRLTLSDRLKGLVGVNAVRLSRSGNSRYGSVLAATAYPDTEKVSPYAGLTYDFTPAVTGYVSYSDIFQNQDQYDINGRYLDPTKGVNYEAGVKAEWLNKRLLTTAAVFSAEQKGLATYAGISGGQYYYEARDVKSKGIELEATGRIDKNSKLTLGVTHLELDGPDGSDTFEWVPRTTVNVTADTRLAALPQLRLGITGRWQSDTRKDGGAHQDAYFLAHAFAAYELTDRATLRLNVNNLFDKKYIGGLSYGAIYGAPRNATLTLTYEL